MKWNAFLFAVILMLSAATMRAQDARWMLLYRDRDVRVLADSTRLRALSDSSYAVWTSWRFTKSQRFSGVSGNYWSVTSQVLVKCDPTLHKTGTTIFYDASGQPVKTDYSSATDLSFIPWQESIPDTIGEFTYGAICEKVPPLLLPAKLR
jgi:hypothetical protein